jgi:predicted regulator of amino acid metabolism with ACT domain
MFGCVAVMRPDGQLLITQINISVAQYPDGKPRRWQGEAQETIIVRKRIAGEVIAALQAKDEVRRVQA